MVGAFNPFTFKVIIDKYDLVIIDKYGQGQQPGGATPCPRSEAAAGRSYPTSKIRSSGCALLEQNREDIPHTRSKRKPSQWRNNSRKNEGMEPRKKPHPVVDRTSDRNKVRCCKEQYCIGNWNVRSMNQGKLELIKHEMTRVNINILGISKLRWTGMG